MDRSTEEKARRRKDPTRTGLIAGLAWFASMFVAMGLALWLTVGKEPAEMSSLELGIAAGCLVWIVGALPMMALTLRWMTRAQEKVDAETREAVLRGFDEKSEENLLYLTFMPGNPCVRCLMFREGEEKFSLREENFSAEKWIPTGREWTADDDGELWAILMAENISEIAWQAEADEDDGK